VESFREVVFDTETDGLEPTIVHCIVVKDINTLEVFKFVQQECYTTFLTDFYPTVKRWVGHNIIAYDIPKVFKKLLGVEPHIKTLEDTFVMSSLFYCDRYQKDIQKWGSEEKIPPAYRIILRDKSHSLAAWGIRQGRYKPEHTDWSRYTPEMLHRCTEDVEINYLTYRDLLKEAQAFSKYSIRLEHKVAQIIAEQVANGMQLDTIKCEAMRRECEIKAAEMKALIVAEIPPVIKRLEDEPIQPKFKELKIDTGRMIKSEKSNRMVKEYEVLTVPSTNVRYYSYIAESLPSVEIRGPFTPISIDAFNPDSPGQRLDVLNKSGWNPINFNKPTDAMLQRGQLIGNPKTTDEENLDTIPDTAPQGIKNLGKYLTYNNRRMLAEQWMGLMDETGRVHGYINPMGTPTGRMRHSCVPMDSKILTRRGWKTYEEVQVGEDVMAYSMEKKVKCWTPLLAKNKYENAAVGSIGQKHTDKRFRCTDNHKWVVRKTNARTNQTEHLVEAKDIKFNHSILVNAPLENDVETRDFKIITKKYDHDWVSEVCQMSDVELNSFMMGFLLADGHIRKNDICWSFAQAEGMLHQALMTCLYLCTDKRVSSVQKMRLKGPNQRWGYQVTTTKNAYVRSKDQSWKFEGYEDVWCPTTQHGTWVMKQGNYITITGNSPNMGNVVAVQVVDKFEAEEAEKLSPLPVSDTGYTPIPEGFPFAGHLLVSGKKPKVILRGIEGKYGWECRSCWTVSNPETHCLVGADAAGLELRMLAHYMNDPEYTNVLLTGDIHAVNQQAAGLSSRAQAKTFIYGFLYGAGDAKVGTIVGGSAKQGRKLKNQFLSNIPALRKLTDRVQREAEKGYLIGLDGRILWIRKPHAALNTLLQSAGAIVMKVALVLAYDEIKKRGLQSFLVNMVHDEFQKETLKAHAKEVGEICVWAIVEAGKFLKLNCPLDGNWVEGQHWGATH